MVCADVVIEEDMLAMFDKLGARLGHGLSNRRSELQSNLLVHYGEGSLVGGGMGKEA